MKDENSVLDLILESMEEFQLASLLHLVRVKILYFLLLMITCNHNLSEPHHEKTCLCHMRTTKAQISQRICAV